MWWGCSPCLGWWLPEGMHPTPTDHSASVWVRGRTAWLSAPSLLWRNCCLYERAQDWAENWLIHPVGVITRNQLCQWLRPVMSMEIFFPGLKRLWLLSISRLFYNMWYCRGVLFFLWDQIQGTISSLLPNNAKLLENMLFVRQNSLLW